MVKMRPLFQVLLLISILLLALGGMVLAQDDKLGPGVPSPEQALPDDSQGRNERLEAYYKIWDDYLAKTKPIHDDLVDQMLIYRATIGNPNILIGDLRSIFAEVKRLRGLLDNEKAAFLKALDEAGLEGYAPGPGHGRGFGDHPWKWWKPHDGRGHGDGHGRGFWGGGHGRGFDGGFWGDSRGDSRGDFWGDPGRDSREGFRGGHGWRHRRDYDGSCDDGYSRRGPRPDGDFGPRHGGRHGGWGPPDWYDYDDGPERMGNRQRSGDGQERRMRHRQGSGDGQERMRHRQRPSE